MVLAGQYLERPAVISRPVAGQDPIALEGLFHRGSRAPAVVICAPHPRMGGSMDSPVVAELAWALTRSGRATLRFNYQGIGASFSAETSLRERDDLTSEVDDARAGVAHLRQSVEHGRVAIAGYSFGAAVALALAKADPSVAAVVLIAPPTSLFDFSAVRELSQPLLVVAGHDDPLTDRPKMAELLIGLGDWEVIAGADHVFSRGLTDLGKTIVRWFDTPKSEADF